MGDIKLLDCTLRDGGYVNDWEFGHDNMINILERLVSAGVDIIEVGFLDERRPFDINRSIMPDMGAVNQIYGGIDRKGSLMVAMIDYGTCGADRLGRCEDSFLDGIRVIFKKKVMREAIAFCREVKELGYLVFAQAVSITSYNDRELLDLVDLVNDLEPCTFSLVDTYGLLHKQQLLHYVDIVDHNLKEGIILGYHAHNNFQLGYANAIELMGTRRERTLVIDGTIYGMGKSAGNACMELLAMYMNVNYNARYDVNQILEALDVTIMNIHRQVFWGYNLLYFVSAANDCHPNYVTHLMEKRTLSIKSINEILSKLEGERKLNFDQAYIESLYLDYQTSEIDDREAIAALRQLFCGREILLIGPGASVARNQEQIRAFIREHRPLVVANNYIPADMQPDYIFLSNSKRYVQLANRLLEAEGVRIIATSNVTKTSGAFDYTLKYSALLDMEGMIKDNSLLMLLRLMDTLQAGRLVLAGFDGYSTENMPNYCIPAMEYQFTPEMARGINRYVGEAIRRMREKLELSFLTESRYVFQEEKWEK